MSNLVERQKQVGTLLQKRTSMINAMFRDEAEAKRFRAIAVSVASNNKLAVCSNDSIISCIMGIAQMRLSIDPNIGHAYVIPYQKKNKQGQVEYTVAQLQVGYKGFIQLLYRAGWFVKAYPVYSCDKFSMEFDNDTMAMKYNYEPNTTEQEDDNNEWVYKNLVGVLVVAKDERGNTGTEFINKKKIEKIRMKSDNQDNKTKPSYIWADWYEEMAKKTAIKKVAKTLALGDERVALAIAVDDKIEGGKVIDVEKTFDEGVIIESEAVETPIEQKLNLNKTLNQQDEIKI